jgi:hypothetical protein
MRQMRTHHLVILHKNSSIYHTHPGARTNQNTHATRCEPFLCSHISHGTLQNWLIAPHTETTSFVNNNKNIEPTYCSITMTVEQSTNEKGGEAIPQEQPTLYEPEPEIVIVDAEEISPAEAVPVPPKPSSESQQQRRGCCGGCAFELQLCGDDIRRGRHVRPGKNVAVKICGNTHLMLPKDPPSGAHYRFVMVNLCGDTRIWVPKQTDVTLRRISLLGNRTIDVDESSEITDSSPRVTVTIVQLCGNIQIMSDEEEFC